MKRLLKKEVKTVNTKVLNMRYCRILDRAGKLEAKDIPVADAREILWIEDEMLRRTIKVVGHDFYPPDNAKPTIGALRGQLNPFKKSTPAPSSKLKPSHTLKPEVKPEPEPGTKIKFKITVTSSIGSLAAKKNVHVDSRSEADLLATKMIRDLGLKKATYKIS